MRASGPNPRREESVSMRAFFAIMLLKANIADGFHSSRSKVLQGYYQVLHHPLSRPPSSGFVTRSLSGAARSTGPSGALPASAENVSSSRLQAIAKALRGGGASDNVVGNIGGREAGSSPPLGVSSSGDGDLEPASEDKTVDEVRKVERETNSGDAGNVGEREGSRPTAAELPAKQESKGDAQENALREALLMAEGPSKILREVERIPALRRLSDSALRVTSATASDGRLAALALYRLGAEARAMEPAAKADSTTPAAAATAAGGAGGAGADGATARVATPTTESVGSDGGDRTAVLGERDFESDVGDDDDDDDDDHNGVDRELVGIGSRISAQVAAPDTAASVFPDTTAGETSPIADGAIAAPVTDCTKDVGGSEELESAGPVRREDGAAARSSALSEGVDAVTALSSAKQDSEKERTQAKEEPPNVLASPPSPAAVAIDVEDVKSDQRFEQLVEIVECVAEELTVSDISKVVWGLSILGHVPRNSLLESLAGLLTDRLRRESGAASPASPTPADMTASAATPAAGGTASAGVREVGGCSDGSGNCTTDDRQGGCVEEDGGQNPESALSTGGDSPGGVAVRAGDGGGDREESGGVRTAGVAERAKPEAPLTSGSDLATAALSFAYAHARLDISTSELLDVIAVCATPQLSSTPLRDLANLTWAFAVQRHFVPDMMAGVGREIVSDRAYKRMSAKDASILAWAYGMLDLRPGRVVRALTREGLVTIQDATPHDLSNLAWGLARVGAGALDETQDDGREHSNDAAGSGDGSVVAGGDGKEQESDTEAERGGSDVVAEESRMPAEEGGSRDGSSGNDGGAWGLGWMRGKAMGQRRQQRRQQQSEPDDELDDEEEEGEEDGDGLTGTGEASGGGAGVVQVTSGAKTDDATTTALVDLASGEEVEVPMEQILREALLARAGESFKQFQPKQLSRLCWALGAWHGQGATSLPGSRSFAEKALSEAGQHPKDYTAEELAQILWAFATLVGTTDSPAHDLAGLVGALAEGFESEGAGGLRGTRGGGRGSTRGRGLDAVTACDVLWAFAKMGHPVHSLCEALARELVDRVPELPPSSVSSLVWAYAKLGHPSSELMERVLSVVERRLDEFSVEEAANALWALGALGYTVVLKREFDVTKEDLGPLSPSASAKLLWGLAKTGAAFADGFDKECLEVVAADMCPKLLSFSPKELCRTAWALGRLGLGGVLGAGSMVDSGGGEGEGDSEDEISATGGGGEMSVLMDKVLGECTKWLEIFTPQDLETLLWAICRLEHRADKLVTEMAVEAKRRQEELPSLLQQSGPSAARDAAFHLGAVRHLLAKYREVDFDGRRAKGRYRRGKSMLSRMFRER